MWWLYNERKVSIHVASMYDAFVVVYGLMIILCWWYTTEGDVVSDIKVVGRKFE